MSIIKPGIVGAGIGAFAAGAGEAIAEIQPWQIDNSNKNQITVHVKRGDTLNEIVGHLDRTFGKYDDSTDIARNLGWHLKSGDIFYTDCRNRITNPNVIEAGRDISFRDKALEEIDPDYGKNISEHKNYEREIAKKNIEIITDSKVPKKWGRSLKSDISNLRSYSNERNNNRTGKFVLNAGLDYSILGSPDEDLGGSVVIDVNAGYDLSVLKFALGGRVGQIEGDKYYRYRRSFFGFLNEGEIDEEYLGLIEIYAQLMLGNDNFKIGGGFGVKNISNVNAGMSYGWREGEGGISRDNDRYTGGFFVLQLMVPLYKDKNGDVYFGVGTRYGEYKTDDGLELNESSVGIKAEAKF